MFGQPVSVIPEFVRAARQIQCIAQGVSRGRTLRNRRLVENTQAQSGI